ncbi:hypothetical protein E2C01_066774 [Portunus trituberculatus]|uniref:Uncharacterized protein n=1 Tax=Portunus trituberculatus TaxID=210409 RepID=A0A5B7HRK6_PORTR|nr:hypothetical protein [Portunus trituberculatus]
MGAWIAWKRSMIGGFWGAEKTCCFTHTLKSEDDDNMDSVDQTERWWRRRVSGGWVRWEHFSNASNEREVGSGTRWKVVLFMERRWDVGRCCCVAEQVEWPGECDVLYG